MNRISLIKIFINNLNKHFPPGNIPTQLYKDRQVVNVKIQAPNNFVAIVGDNSCEIYCFKYGTHEDPYVLKNIKILEKILKQKIVVKMQHVAMQRMISQEANNDDKLVIGKIW